MSEFDSGSCITCWQPICGNSVSRWREDKKNAGGVLFHTNQRDNKIDILKPGKCQEAKGYSSKSMQTAKYYGTSRWSLETTRVVRRAKSKIPYLNLHERAAASITEFPFPFPSFLLFLPFQRFFGSKLHFLWSTPGVRITARRSAGWRRTPHWRGVL